MGGRLSLNCPLSKAGHTWGMLPSCAHRRGTHTRPAVSDMHTVSVDMLRSGTVSGSYLLQHYTQSEGVRPGAVSERPSVGPWNREAPFLAAPVSRVCVCVCVPPPPNSYTHVEIRQDHDLAESAGVGRRQ